MSDRFDGNEYRKRVLAAVHGRGGPDASDPFELYDLPPVDDLDDRFVTERVGEVWGFWQRQRDHPKYRVLVAELVEDHTRRSAELLDAGRRRTAAARVRAQREQRDAQRFALLDAAISRLVDRHGGLPADKLDGLHEVGALAGLRRDEVATRLRRHRVLNPEPRSAEAPAVSADRRRQLRALLDEFGRLTDVSPPPTLLALLELAPAATDEQVRARAGAWRTRARELPPGRLRAVLDELLVHVAELIEPGRTAVEGYLAAVAADVAEHLRPRVRAAVLVEDRLVADDHEHLLTEAMALGLDRARAATVLAGVAAELGAEVETGAPPTPAPAGRTPAPTTTAPDPGWQEPLRAARAALRAGRPVQAGQLVAEAQRTAGPDGRTQVRAVADEVAAVLEAAERRWRAATADCAARRFADALPHLQELARTASDLPAAEELPTLLALATAAVERADAAVASVMAGAESERAGALLRVLADCPGHPGAVQALAATPLAAPAWVTAVRDPRGDVVVTWAPSASPEVGYKVARRRPDGSWQVVGRCGGTELADGGVPAGEPVPVYAVHAVQPGRVSAERRSDDVTPSSAPSPPTPTPEPTPTRSGSSKPCAVSAARTTSGSVQVSWAGPADVEYRVRCRRDDGGWRVVGRTRAATIEDGGAPTGALPVYAVSAVSAGGERSDEVSTED